MDTKIFLQEFDSKKSSNTSSGLNMQFKGRKKNLPLNDVAEVISQYDQYREERNNCNIIRLTCQVNPICSNVLFNHITEIVRDEGSDKVWNINYGLGEENIPNVIFKNPSIAFWSGGTMEYFSLMTTTDSKNSISTEMSVKNSLSATTGNIIHPTNSIRDTQLSKSDVGFVYHCGLDFFNNHLIRSKTFKTICKMGDDEISDAFNTIADYMRDVKGNAVNEKIYFPIDANVQNHSRLCTLHLYEYDDIHEFSASVNTNLVVRHDGWVGFKNRSKIKSYRNFIGNTKVNSEDMEIERPLMNYNGGDFVDMYPGRDLYSFLPKYNTFRNRIEKNWNYSITYPSSSYTPSTNEEPFSDVIESNGRLNSLKAIYFDENIKADNGTSQVVVYSIAKHGLSKGDYVNVYRTFSSATFWVEDINGERISDIFYDYNTAKDELSILQHDFSAQTSCDSSNIKKEPFRINSANTQTINEKILDNVEVTDTVGEYIFLVFNPNVQISNNWVYLSEDDTKQGAKIILSGISYVNKGSYFVKMDDDLDAEGGDDTDDTDYPRYYIVNDSYVNFDENAQHISYKKVVGGIECDYYIRIFSKLPNFKFADDDVSNEYALYRNNGEVIRKYQNKDYDFESHVSRLAFAKNIYTDDIGEIVFTDDIDISNLHDNLGRPLTSLYLTFTKNNKGYKEWYGYDYTNGSQWKIDDINDINVEFSHAFGKVTYGIETSEESMFEDNINSIFKINNITKNARNGVKNAHNGYLIGGIIRPSGLTYNTSKSKTIAIDDSEIWYDIDTNFYGDLCYYDSYNAIERVISPIMHRFNTAQRESFNSSSSGYYGSFIFDNIKFDDYDVSEQFTINAIKSSDSCNNKKEGYYYNPHYEIPIKTFDKLETIMPDFLTIREIKHLNDNIYVFTTLQQHFLSIGDKAILYDKINDTYYNLIAVSGCNYNYKVFTCMVYDEETNNECSITERADLSDFILFKMDNLECPSYAKVLKDGTCRIIWRNVLNNGFGNDNDGVEEYPFTNGAFYVNRRVDIYVRRQDPHDLNGLYDSFDIIGNDTNIFNEDNYIKEADIEC